MTDPDGPSVTLTDLEREEQERMPSWASLASYLYMQLRAESLPDALVNELVSVWFAQHLSFDDD